MERFDWRPFLEQYSRELLADRRIRSRLPEAVVDSAWMGFEPASSVEIRELEDRIGAALPESYKQFLAVSNGWRESGGFIYEVWPCAKVDWFRVQNQDWIDAYTEPAKGDPPLPVSEHCVYGPDQAPWKFRLEFLQSTLLISDRGDDAVYLLNPEVKTASGEWEAWFFANWAPGATRYRSFWDLMQAERESAIRLRDQNEKRYFPEDGIETLAAKLPYLIDDLAEKAADHRSGQRQRASRGDPDNEAATDATIEALEEAAAAVRQIAELRLSPADLHSKLAELATALENEWQANFQPDSCDSEQEGLAEGCREAAGIISWFLNQPQT